MIRLTKDAYSDALAAIDPQSCGAVYPLSAASGIQCGDIFAAKDAFVIRHSCGFAFLAGSPDQHVLSEVYAQFLAPDAAFSERFLLFLQDGPALRYFQAQRGLTIERRLFFAYRQAQAPEAVPLPEGFSCCEITMPLLMQMQGKVTPFFSWTQPDAFLRDGRGFCFAAISMTGHIRPMSAPLPKMSCIWQGMQKPMDDWMVSTRKRKTVSLHS